MPDVDETKVDETETEETTAPETDWKAETDKWKAMARKHEAQAKANASAAKRLQEAEARAARYEVAAELGIQTKHLKYLSGSTKEEIEESAKGIIEDFPEVYHAAKDEDDKSETRRPKERLRPGAAKDEEPDETDPRKLAANIPRI